MWRFLKRKHAINSDEASDEIRQGHEASDEEAQAPDQFHCISSSTTGRKKILYDGSHFSMGFTKAGNPGCPILLCVMCGKRLSKAAFAPAKLKRLYTTNHSDMKNKSADYFKRLLESHKKHSTAFFCKVSVN